MVLFKERIHFCTALYVFALRNVGGGMLQKFTTLALAMPLSFFLLKPKDPLWVYGDWVGQFYGRGPKIDLG